MTKAFLTKIKNNQFPVVVEKDENGFYVVECPLFIRDAELSVEEFIKLL